MFLAPFGLLTVSLAALVWSGTIAVRTLSRMASYLQVSEYLMAFVFVGIATSIPNIAVSVAAALGGDPILAFTSNIGSNIIYPTLLLGLAAIMARRLPMGEREFSTTNLIAVSVSLLPFVLIWDGELGRLDAALLITVALLYFARLLTREGMFRRVYHNILVNHRDGHLWTFFRDLGLFIFAIGVLVISAQGVVTGSNAVAQAVGIPLSVIGLFVVAFSVTLPEISFTLRAVLTGHREMALGAFFGTLVINAGFAIGPAALIAPISIVQHAALWNMAFFSVGSLGLLFLLGKSDNVLTWKEGLVLIFAYLLFLFFGLIIAGA